MKVRQFSGATRTDMYDNLKPILKRHPELLILHIGTNGTSKYPPNKILYKVLSLKRLIASQNEKCKIIILTLTIRVDSSKKGNAVQKLNNTLEELNILLVKKAILLGDI